MKPINIIILCVVLILIFAIPDVLVELLHGAFELLAEVLHTLFEMLEVVLDNVIEHVFHTGLHDTQIIVFYILFLLALYGLLKLSRFSFRYCQRCHERWLSAKAVYKTQLADYWQGLGWFKKLGAVLFSSLLVSGVLFLLFM